MTSSVMRLQLATNVHVCMFVHTISKSQTEGVLERSVVVQTRPSNIAKHNVSVQIWTHCLGYIASPGQGNHMGVVS